MRGQIDDTAAIRGNGAELRVTGWAEFDAGERDADIRVTVTQGGSQASGSSGRTNNDTWKADAVGGRFVAGSAHAVATATVYKNGGTEPYPAPGQAPWERDITLVPH